MMPGNPTQNDSSSDDGEDSPLPSAAGRPQNAGRPRGKGVNGSGGDGRRSRQHQHASLTSLPQHPSHQSVSRNGSASVVNPINSSSVNNAGGGGGDGGRGGAGGPGYHRAPLRMPAGSNLNSNIAQNLTTELRDFINPSQREEEGAGPPAVGAVGNGGVLRKSMSPLKARKRAAGAAAVGGGIELRSMASGSEGYVESDLESGSNRQRDSQGGKSKRYSLGAQQKYEMEAAQRIIAPKGPVRVTRRINYFTQSIVLTFIVVTSTLFVWKMVALSLDDGYWGRMANVAFLPAIIIFMLFIVHFGITQIVCALGPVAHMQTNSQFFSALAPARAHSYPNITVQMPVYKEGLEAVILPSIISLEAAISHYRKAGGFASIFINDDGLQVIGDKERAERIAVYRAHKIAYVARPPHSVKKRAGLFKKASTTVGDLMEEQGITDPALALSMVQEAAGGEFLAGGDLSMGAIVLLVDSDTRVPEDCLTKVVGEFLECPNLGFVQCRTTPLRAEDNYWEDMIAHFTENIYDIGIALSVSGGDPAPLVGHNAFLRWEAMKAVSWVKDGERKFWSESHVSEDFDMSLRLQTRGFIGRYATYTGAGFQEGVSLTCADEVIRLRKYAYGACEMLLNKFKHWPCRGPITSLFWRYLGAKCIPWPSKLQMAGYLGTYLAMAYSVVGISVYVLLRMFYGVLQEDITNTYDVFITVVFVFGVIGIFGAGTIRYRMGFAGDVTIFKAYWIELRNAPAMTMFWSHILWHITTACWCYFWDLDIVWGATAKEATHHSFWVEFKDTLSRYKWMYILLTLLYAAFSFGMYWTGQEWSDQRLSFPLTFYVATHFLGPFLLNPVLTRGYY